MGQSDCLLCVWCIKKLSTYHKLYSWHSATRIVSEHILQPKKFSNFGMASASVDVAILQLKGQICTGLLGYFLKTGACNGKRQRPNLGFRYPCLLHHLFRV